MKYFWLAATVRENDRCYSFAFRVSEDTNLKCRLEGIQNLYYANIMPSKRRAVEVANAWNDAWKAKGIFLFDNPAF